MRGKPKPRKVWDGVDLAKLPVEDRAERLSKLGEQTDAYHRALKEMRDLAEKLGASAASLEHLGEAVRSISDAGECLIDDAEHLAEDES